MPQKSVNEATGKEMFPGVVRKTLAYNKDVMLCHFSFDKGGKIPLHDHVPSQIGYVVKGRVRFIGATEADAFEANAGDSYVIDPSVQHGGEALEPSELVEVFNPSRDEYQDF